jgi:uncharacterized membrane protein (DUF2068 family)
MDRGTHLARIALRLLLSLELLALLAASGFLIEARSRAALLPGIVLVLQLVALVGVWNLKRWAIVTYAVLLPLGLLGAALAPGVRLTPTAIAVVVVVRGSVLALTRLLRREID